MNILFLTMSNFKSINEHNIYPDLVRELSRRGHMVTVLTPYERKNTSDSELIFEQGTKVLRVKTGNLFNVNFLEKLISRATLSLCYKRALNKFCDNEHYDLIIYSTPPTTFSSIVYSIKKRDNAVSYLMLKDIFPQNAVDLGMISQNGFLYHLLRVGEKKLYRVSDYIGCMSPANIKYLLNQDSWIPAEKVGLCPNAIEIFDKPKVNDRGSILNKYYIPDKIICIYGGGLGKPQGIEFLIKCIKKMKDDSDFFFVIVGDGPYYESLKRLEKDYRKAMKVIKWLPVNEYETLVNVADIGLVFLDYNFKIPNFPSRLLLYMQACLPILAATDPNSDIGRIAEENEFGVWCKSNDANRFAEKLSKFKDIDKRRTMGRNARRFLEKNYNVKILAQSIEEKVLELKK